jgi:Rrf2 family transcriptional regulator, cysteine metabolism repressor
MRLSKRSEYGLRAVVQLAADFNRGFIQIRQISRREKLPNKFLESILRSLKSAGLLMAKVGASGGYKLADRPETITIGQLLTVLEGEIVSAELLQSPGDPAVMERGKLGVHLVARRLRRSVAEALDKFTLADLLEEVTKVQSRSQSMYYI